jgi:hypothetical protein
MTMTQLDDENTGVYRDLSKADELLTAAEAALAAGRDFSLVEFNATLDCVCVGAVRLPQSEFKSVRKQLKALIGRLQSMRTEVVRMASAA